MNENKKYCVLVDDDDDDQLIFRTTVEREFPNYQYKGIVSFEELQQFLSNTDLTRVGYIFLDLNIPKKNGFEILDFLKSKESTKRLKVIIYTTSNNPKDVNECLKKGAEAFITKPSKITDLIAELAKYLS